MPNTSHCYRYFFGLLCCLYLTAASAQTPIYTESYEDTNHGWQVSGYPNVWLRRSGSTPSSNTGPTGGYAGAQYFYTEASGSNSNRTAYLESPAISLPAGQDISLSFAYHLYGTSVGALRLSVKQGAVTAEEWSLTGSQDNQWNVATVDLSAYAGSNIQLRFTGITGNGWSSDMAVDNIIVEEAVLPTGGGDIDFSTCDAVIRTFPYRESFDLNDGGWTEDRLDGKDIWRRRTGNSPSGGTGPNAANDGSYYQYTEASGANYPGMESALVSPCFDFTTAANVTLTFDYHLYGSDMGVLEVQAQAIGGGPWRSLWQRSGNVGNRWEGASVNLGTLAGGAYRLRFWTRTGSGYRSDAAIDKLEITTTPAPPPGDWGEVVSSYPYAENFDATFGKWTAGGAENIFRRRTGSTPSGGTGPGAAFSGTHYVYTETSSPNFGQKQGLLTGPTFNLRNVERAECLFNYHALGADINRLELQASTNAGRRWRALWTQAGEDADGELAGKWHEVAIDLKDFIGKRVKLRFMTITGDSYRGDIAIDNFRLVIPEDNTNLAGTVLFLPQGVAYDHADPLAGDRVENVLVRILPQDGSTPVTVSTDYKGHFEAGIATGLVDLLPEVQDNDYQEGLGADDLVLLNNHILGSELILDPIGRLAADVNRDGELNIFDVIELQTVSTSTSGESFANAPNWQLVADYYLRESATLFHPDPAFRSDFWNESPENAAGELYPYLASLHLPERRLVYASEDDWVGQLANWQLAAGVAAESCRPGANFILFKTGDINRSANPHSFSVPSPNALAGTTGATAKSSAPEKGWEKRLLRLTEDKRTYEVSVFATSSKNIHGFQSALRYDPELIRIKRVLPNESDLYRRNGNAFSDLGTRRDPVVRTVWAAQDRRGRRFERDASSRADDLSDGKLLFRLEIEGYVNRRVAKSAIGFDPGELPTRFHNRKGREIEDVDVEIYLTKQKRKRALGDKVAEDTEVTRTQVLSVYPNPVSTTLRFTLPAVGVNEVRLLSPEGRSVLQRNYPNGTAGTQEVPVGDLTPGVYYLEALGDQGLLGTERVVIVR